MGNLLVESSTIVNVDEVTTTRTISHKQLFLFINYHKKYQELMSMITDKKMTYIKRFLLIILLLFLFLSPFALYFGLIAWPMNAHGIPMTKIVQLHEGMSENEVKTLVGEPKEIYSHDDGSKEWSYSRYTWCYIIIRFSPDGKVVKIVHDH